MLSRAPYKLRKVGQRVGMLLLISCGGALAGAVLGVFVSLVFPDQFTTIVACFASVFALGLPLLAWRDVETWPAHFRDTPEQERAKVAARLARLRKPSWKGMGRQVAGAVACLGAAVLLFVLPSASVSHFIAAFLLLRIPGKVISSVGGKWERIIGGALTFSSALIMLAAYALQNPGSIPTSVFIALAGWTIFDFVGVVGELYKDFLLLAAPENSEIT